MVAVAGITSTESLKGTLGISEDPDSETLITEMMRLAEKGNEPGDMQAGDVLHRGDEPKYDESGAITSFPPPIVTGSIKSAGYAIIYDTLTGEPSLTNRNMLPTQLRKVREDGTRVFDVRPHPQTRVGKTICFLHKDYEGRAHYDELGFPACTKHNLQNPYQRDRHMAKRHKDEWAAIQEELRLSEKAEDRAFQRKMAADLHKRVKASAKT